jgi:hypothetical protein
MERGSNGMLPFITKANALFGKSPKLAPASYFRLAPNVDHELWLSTWEDAGLQEQSCEKILSSMMGSVKKGTEVVKDKIRTLEETHGLLSMEMLKSLSGVEVSFDCQEICMVFQTRKFSRLFIRFLLLQDTFRDGYPLSQDALRDFNAVHQNRSRFIFPEKIRPRLQLLFKVAKEVLETPILERIYTADELVRIAAVFFQQLLRNAPLQLGWHTNMVAAARLLFNGILRDSLSVPIPLYCEGREEFTANLKTRRAVEEPWDIVVHALLSAHRQCCDELFLLL